MRKIISTTREIMKKIALTAISSYQRHLSPVKGYACAYRVHAGGISCSAYGYRVIDRHGIALGLALLRRRLFVCTLEHRHHDSRRTSQPPALRRQAGFCDAACDCNVGDGFSTLGNACDLVSQVADFWRSCRSCDFKWWRRSAPSNEMNEAERRIAQRRQARMDGNRPPGGGGPA